MAEQQQQQTYANGIPPLPALSIQLSAAGGITAGEPLNADDIIRADDDRRKRRCLHPEFVDTASLAIAHIRYGVVLHQHVRAAYPEVEEPAWFTNRMNQMNERLDQRLDQMYVSLKAMVGILCFACRSHCAIHYRYSAP